MSRSSTASGGSRKAAFILAAALVLLPSVNLGQVAESSAAGPEAVAAKKCKKGKKPAAAAKRCKKKTASPMVVPGPSTPLPLTDSEVIDRIGEQAGWYCWQDPDCTGKSGHYHEAADPARALCSSRSIYTWTCDGYYDRGSGIGQTCDFREVVEREGVSGIRSHQDPSFGGDGFACHLSI